MTNRTDNGITRDHWKGMIGRCTKPHYTCYKWYGARGISVCERWMNSLEAFREDMGPRPSARHTVDRIDVNGNYEPGNCRWATWKVQIANRRPVTPEQQAAYNRKGHVSRSMGKVRRAVSGFEGSIMDLTEGQLEAALMAGWGMSNEAIGVAMGDRL